MDTRRITFKAKTDDSSKISCNKTGELNKNLEKEKSQETDVNFPPNTQTYTSSVAMPPLPTMTTRRAPESFF